MDLRDSSWRESDGWMGRANETDFAHGDTWAFLKRVTIVWRHCGEILGGTFDTCGWCGALNSGHVFSAHRRAGVRAGILLA